MPRVWFGQKRVGWGARPVSWQGWGLTALYVALGYVAARTLAAHHIALFVTALVVLTAGYVLVVFATSSGRS
jgi:hypothetical protein